MLSNKFNYGFLSDFMRKYSYKWHYLLCIKYILLLKIGEMLMFEQFLKMPHTIKRLKKSKFKRILDRCAKYLIAKRYSEGSIRHYRLVLEHFFNWLELQNISSINKINAYLMEQFIKSHIPICQCSIPAAKRMVELRPAFRLLQKLLKFSNKHVVKPISQIDQIINEFYSYLINVRGLAYKTCKYHTKNVKIFINKIFPKNYINFKILTPSKIRNFLYNNFLYYNRRTFGLFIYSIRSFCKYLQFKGIINNSLIESFPRIIEYKSTTIPESLTKAETNILLESFDRNTAIGKRDYAIVICIMELGLRAGEVANITLDEINWKDQTIYLPLNKTRESHVLPITPLMQKAIIDYLQNGRPKTSARQVFVYHRAPVGQGIISSVVTNVIMRAIVRTQLKSNSKGANLLRSTFATNLLQKGATLKEIADLLGHNSIDTTTIYTKVDFSKLTQVALPWFKEAM